MSPYTATTSQAAESLKKMVNTAKEQKRKTSILWIGPTAPGHIYVKGHKGNQEVWDFDRMMKQAAMADKVEALSMWNMTVQASSWDGVRFGSKVTLTQAMMVVNWLSRVDSAPIPGPFT